ncbi:MAG: glutaredoxin [Thermoproteota archaeon]|nr:MAG: glutaredoxin [Candidatus Korarchaeota archaeon]
MVNGKRILNEKLRSALEKKFRNNLEDEVHLILFKGLGNEKYEDWCERLLTELEELSDKIRTSVFNVLERTELIEKYEIISTPTILISPEKGYKIRCTGSPAGYEAMSFIETIVAVSKGESSLGSKAKEVAKEIMEKGIEVKASVFVTPSCPYCPQQVLNANKFAIEAKGYFSAECIEAQENIELATKFNVSAVPHTVIFVKENGEWVPKKDDLIGLIPEDIFAEEILKVIE